MSRKPTPRGKKAPVKLYEAEGGKTLFVPSELLWLLHNHAHHLKVSERAGIPPQRWKQWKERYRASHPWLLDWLYNEDLPQGMGTIRRRGLPIIVLTDGTRFPPDTEMLAFRREASGYAVARAAANIMGKRGRVQYGCGGASTWLTRFKHLPWFAAWLRRGSDAPSDVTVASEDQIRRCRSAWDYARHCKSSGISLTTYQVWLKSSLIPDIDWLKWLFGWPAPAGAIVANAAMRRCREARSRIAIAGLDRRGVRGERIVSWGSCQEWMKDDLHRQALQWAKGTANRDGRKPAEPEWPEQFAGVHWRTKRAIWRFALAATNQACCERARVRSSEVNTWFRNAEATGGADLEAALRRYLRLDGPDDGKNQHGLIAPGLFVPTADMIKFREKAQKAMATETIAKLVDLPAFDKWFLDWTAPAEVHGNRPALTRLVRMPAANGKDADNGLPTVAAKAGEASSPEPRRRGRKTNPATWKKYRVCSELYARVEAGELKMVRAINEARKRLGDNAPKEGSHLRKNAQRYRTGANGAQN